MREALILLFLIVSYNFLLWYITWMGFSPIPVFPQDPYNTVLVLSYNSALYVSWLFGERHRMVQWIGYLFVVQIIALSIYFEDLKIIVKDLSPVILTFALVVLFESPTEKKIKGIEKEREELLREIDRVRRERERVEVHLRMLRTESGGQGGDIEPEEGEEEAHQGDNREEDRGAEHQDREAGARKSIRPGGQQRTLQGVLGGDPSDQVLRKGGEGVPQAARAEKEAVF